MIFYTCLCGLMALSALAGLIQDHPANRPKH